jgi:hypothetical protein
MYLLPGQSITAVLTSSPTTTSPTYFTCFRNQGPQSLSGSLSNSAQTIVTSSAQGSPVPNCNVDFININNADTVSCTVTINLVTTNISSLGVATTTTVQLEQKTLAAGQSMRYLLGSGWQSTSSSGQQVTSGTFPAGNVTLTGLLYETATDGITSGTTQTQAGATQLSAEVNRITTNATAGNGVALPAATAAGLTILVINYTANALQVYGNSANADTINGIATATGVSQMPYSAVLYISSATGKWFTEGLANGFTTSGAYVTSSFADSITAYASGGQASATALVAMQNRVTTAANQGASVKLPTSQAGMQITIDNRAGNAIQVFGNGTDTINSITSSTGISQAIGQVATYYCFTAGNWEVQFSQLTQVGIVALSANAAIPPHVAHTYVVTKTGSAGAFTLAAPTATTDDGLTITVTSNTAFAHAITATGLLQTGSASVNSATFAASAGASITLMAYQGKWNVLNSNAVTFA